MVTATKLGLQTQLILALMFHTPLTGAGEEKEVFAELGGGTLMA